MLKNYFVIKKKMSFLKISDPVKRDQTVKEYLELKKKIFGIIYSQREPENNNYKPNLQSFIDLLPKRKKLQRERLPKDLILLEKVSRNYHRSLEKHQRKKRKKRKSNNYKTTEIIAITKVGTKSAIHTTIMERTGATYSLIMESTGRVEDGKDGG